MQLFSVGCVLGVVVSSAALASVGCSAGALDATAASAAAAANGDDAMNSASGASSSGTSTTDGTASTGTSGAASSSTSSSTSSSSGTTTRSYAGPEGWYVWTGRAAVTTADGAPHATQTLTVTEAEMAWSVGPSADRPWCPAGNSCTYDGGITVRGFAGSTGRFHVMDRVRTGSDLYQSYGKVRIASEGVLELAYEEQYSCAHPSANADSYRHAVTQYARFFTQNGVLYLSDGAATAPAADGTYTTFRAITEADARDRYDHRYTKPEGVPHCMCPKDYMAPPPKLTTYTCDGIAR